MTDPTEDEPGTRSRRIARRIQRELVSGALREQWGAAVATVVDDLLRTPVERLVDAERIRRALTASLSRPAVEESTQPLVRHAMRLCMARLASRSEPAGDFVPPSARSSLDELVARPDIVPAEIVQEVMRDPAVEEVLRDVLFEALRQFSESASPFTAEWGLPALLKRLPPFGAAPLRKAIETMRADFDKRLEPEIRKFLAGFSKRAARRATELSLRKQQEPEFIALRQRVVSAVLKRELGELVWPPDDPRGELLIEVVVETVGHVLVHDALREELDRFLDAALEAHGDRPLGDVLRDLGVEVPDVAAAAEAYWPLVEQILDSQALGSALEQVVADALAHETSEG